MNETESETEHRLDRRSSRAASHKRNVSRGRSSDNVSVADNDVTGACRHSRHIKQGTSSASFQTQHRSTLVYFRSQTSSNSQGDHPCPSNAESSTAATLPTPQPLTMSEPHCPTCDAQFTECDCPPPAYTTSSPQPEIPTPTPTPTLRKIILAVPKRTIPRLRARHVTRDPAAATVSTTALPATTAVTIPAATSIRITATTIRTAAATATVSSAAAAIPKPAAISAVAPLGRLPEQLLRRR